MKLYKKLTSLLLVALGATNLVAAEPFHWADNVCNQSVPVKKDLIIEQPVQYEIKVASMCGLLPCTKTRLETKTDQSIKTVIQYVNKLTCCPGYAETPSRRCVAVCSEPCGPAGKCVAPEVCRCQTEPSQSAPGFSGNTCRRFTCPTGDRWGTACERECPSKCGQNMYCTADTGKCVCEPGWYGVNCTSECSSSDQTFISECNFMSQVPPVIEPDANLVVDNTMSSRSRKAEALVLDNEDGPNAFMEATASEQYSMQPWTASSYLIGLLSAMSLILLIAFLVVKKRYEFVRNELYYASVASVGRGSGGGSPQSDYSTYYSASQSPSEMSSANMPGKNLESNLSFAAATRNILAGGLPNQTTKDKRIQLFSPKTESHLITSQKSSKRNIYSEAQSLPGGIANRSRAQTPTPASPATIDDDDHIYQVPKRSPINNSLNTSADSTITHTARDESMFRQSDVSIDLGDDGESNIYEELKPRQK